MANTTKFIVQTACFPVTASRGSKHLGNSFIAIRLPIIQLKMLTYSIVHIVVGSPIHVVTGPLEEALLSNASRLLVSCVIEFVFRFAQVGVIKLWPCLTLAHF